MIPPKASFCWWGIGWPRMISQPPWKQASNFSCSKMRHFSITVAAALLTGSALAQTAPPANPNPSTPAVTTPGANSAGAPAAGANSFTEAQAKDRLAAAGFTNVSALTKDKDGVWRGKASKAGTMHDVSLDYQGNIVPK